MSVYGQNHFTWNGTLRDLHGSYTGFCTGRGRPSMTATLSSSSGLEVLLSTLQNVGDVESTLNILSVLDELLSAGTDRRIHYMIKKGGSEALLTALVKYGHTFSPNYTILIPLLHLLAKVGHKDRRIGMKAEEAGAVLLTLNLLKHNDQHARRTAACLWVIQVFCSSVSTANLIGENHGLDVIYRLIPQYTTKHLHAIKAAINAFSALLCTKANVCSAVSKGYISGFLWLYEDWHNKDNQDVAIAIRHALLCCLLKATDSTAGRQAFLSQGGIRLLYQTAQTCLLSKNLECLVEPSMQLMRKCLPRIPLPVTSDQSAYSFLLPGTPAFPDVSETPDESSDESDAEEAEDNHEANNRDYDDDLETDLNKLRLPPDPDRPKELLTQYSCFCPELSHDFQELDLSSETGDSSTASSSSDDEVVLLNKDRTKTTASRDSSTSDCSYSEMEISSRDMPAAAHLEACDFHSHSSILGTSPGFRTMVRGAMGEASPCQREDEQDNEEGGTEEFYHHTIIDRLLERHGAGIPHHDPKLYCAVASKTKSIPDFSILAFPDFWGHLPPPGHQPMAPRKPNIQRQKVFEDIHRFLKTDDIINHVVFDLEDNKVRGRRKAGYKLGQLTRMQPVLYSVKEALEGRPHWIRTGTEICYFRNNFCPAQGRRRTTFYTLTFTITFKHIEDVCYLAYHYPYTYSALMAHLKILQKSVDPAKVFFKQQTLCSTLAGNSCPVVTITACPVSRRWKDLHQMRNRPYIVLSSRVHPGESNASWVMKGTLEFLCSNDLVAQSLREAFVFKVIPMLNPDGVINGTNRCDLNSKDLNRQWSKPDPLLSPTIYHTKGFLYYLNIIGRTPVVFCDYHGHSRKKNVFLYGCSIKETLWQSGSAVDTVGLKEDPGYRTIPKTLDRIAPTFSFNSCNFLVEKSRSATARVVVWREMGVLRSYTLENTYNGCNQGIYKGLQTGTQEHQEMGMKFCHSVLSVTKDTRILYSRKLINHIDLDHNMLDHKSHNCFEDDEPPCAEEIEYSVGCPTLKGSDLDSDIDSNMAHVDEDDKDDKEHSAQKHQQDSISQSQQSSIKNHLFPPQTRQPSVDTPSERRDLRNGLSIAK
ncbi:cytosolic carboxypeptidase 4 [Neolamprologus brichardi]|uniref:cytosolic carboxypeptidase 4 n=1 Tax=Neolamprologus brichardi TaxID=32507 RepID=UPI001643CDD9|nr:cytosolic carboxypeptidase 4 [Neolamprologus brichardi]